MRLTGAITPVIAADTDNWEPAGFETTEIALISVTGAYYLGGIAGGSRGRTFALFVEAGTLTLTDEAGSSADENRFAIGADTTLAAGDGVLVVYDHINLRWRIARVIATGGGGGGGSSTITIGATFDGLGAVLVAGTTCYVRVPVACTIVEATALADQSGSAVVDVWADSYANFPPTDADSITASAPITVTAATKSTDTTLTGWDTAVVAGDVVAFHLDSCSAITRLQIQLKATT